MSKFVAGVIGWGLSIVWTAFVFVAGIVTGWMIFDINMKKQNDEIGGLHEV